MESQRLQLANRLELLKLEENKEKLRIKTTRKKLKMISKIKKEKERRLERVYFIVYIRGFMH